MMTIFAMDCLCLGAAAYLGITARLQL
jgi:hypothetical protein